MGRDEPIPCECGELGPSKADLELYDFDLAIHDCQAGEWLWLAAAVPDDVKIGSPGE